MITNTKMKSWDGFPFAESSILVTLSLSGMEVYNTCIFHEKIFSNDYQEFDKKKPSEYTLITGIKHTGKTLEDFVPRIQKFYFAEFDDTILNTYGKTPLKKTDYLLPYYGFKELEEKEWLQFLMCNEGKSCVYCFKVPEKLFICTKCKKVYYCSKNCQLGHWNLVHKTRCSKYKVEDKK